MKATIKNKSRVLSEALIDVCIYAYVLLFFYTAFSKIIIYSSFLKVLSELPIIGGMHALLAPVIIVLETGLGILLLFPNSRIKALWGSMILMMFFTLYLGYHVMVKSNLPCSCGGVISGFTWPQHITFNSLFIFLAFIGLYLDNRQHKL